MKNLAGLDQDAVLYEALAPELLGFAVGLVGRNDAEDVMASAFARSFGAPAWPSVTNRRSYLYRAVFNEAQRLQRRSALRRDREARAAGTNRWELPGYQPEVRAAVERLSVRQRAVVLLTYWADLDPATIAERLALSEGTVRRHLARARAQLRKVLDD